MGPYVPPGQSPPFEVVDDFHHGAWIIITVALGLVVSLVCFLIRLYVRLLLMPPFARDDIVLLGATVSSCRQLYCHSFREVEISWNYSKLNIH